ncbi:MAG: hypothetical protein R6W84_14600 [Promethearchaeia archaeon]
MNKPIKAAFLGAGNRGMTYGGYALDNRRIQTFELELVLELLGEPSYTHAYFPRWAFNEWDRIGNWVFGRRNDSFIALYSYNPIEWKNYYELKAEGKKNLC